jgi:hypothetical protein
MSLTWKDGLATVFVGAAALLYLLWVGGTTVTGLSGPRALTVAIVGLGIGGCHTAKSHLETVYGVGGRPASATSLRGICLGPGWCHARRGDRRACRWRWR